MNRVFNTNFENAMRLLIALDSLQQPVNEFELVDADFAATYARYFNVGATDLHGLTSFVDSIYTQRRSKAHEALRSLVASGYVTANHDAVHPVFTISGTGRERIKTINSSYTSTYKKYVHLALTAIRDGHLRVLKNKGES